MGRETMVSVFTTRFGFFRKCRRLLGLFGKTLRLSARHPLGFRYQGEIQDPAAGRSSRSDFGRDPNGYQDSRDHPRRRPENRIETCEKYPLEIISHLGTSGWGA